MARVTAFGLKPDYIQTTLYPHYIQTTLGVGANVWGTISSASNTDSRRTRDRFSCRASSTFSAARACCSRSAFT